MNMEEETKEERSRKKVSQQLFFSLLFVGILLITGFSFFISPAFSIGTVAVEGNSYMTEKEILELAEIPENVNIFRLNPGEIQDKLCRDLRVESAAATRSFPSKLTIQITERVPVAYIACDYGFIEVGKEGFVLAAYRTLKNIRVPIVTGITLHNLFVGDQVEGAPLRSVLAYLAAMDEKARNQLSEVNMADTANLLAYTNASVQIRLGAADELLQEKARYTQEFLFDEKIKQLPVAYVDFNFASPFIKMRK